MRLLFLDTETTGLSPQVHEIIEFSILIRDGVEEYQETFKIQPDHIETAHPRALEINGYNNQEWQDAISQSEAAIKINNLVRDGIVVGHNVEFDLRFMIQLMEYHGIAHHIPEAYICTQKLARQMQYDLGWQINSRNGRGPSMDKIRDQMNWSRENAHTAKQDVLDCARLYDFLTTQ